jgi:hypothetical protein
MSSVRNLRVARRFPTLNPQNLIHEDRAHLPHGIGARARGRDPTKIAGARSTVTRECVGPVPSDLKLEIVVILGFVSVAGRRFETAALWIGLPAASVRSVGVPVIRDPSEFIGVGTSCNAVAADRNADGFGGGCVAPEPSFEPGEAAPNGAGLDGELRQGHSILNLGDSGRRRNRRLLVRRAGGQTICSQEGLSTALIDEVSKVPLQESFPTFRTACQSTWDQPYV